MNDRIWLEVLNVRLENKSVQIQVKGDKADREPVWWEVDLVKAGYGEDAKPPEKDNPPEKEKLDPNAAYRTIADGLDKKRIVLANLVSNGSTLKCESIRVQYAESNSR